MQTRKPVLREEGKGVCVGGGVECVCVGGGSKSASLLSTPPTSSPSGASEATELRITNGRHWPGKKL